MHVDFPGPIRSLIHSPVKTLAAKQPTRKPSFIERGLLGGSIQEAPILVPGIVLTAAIVAAAIFISEQVNNTWAYQGVASFILIAIVFEERDLLNHFGNQYRRYLESTPMLLPWPRKKSSASMKAAGDLG